MRGWPVRVSTLLTELLSGTARFGRVRTPRVCTSGVLLLLFFFFSPFPFLFFRLLRARFFIARHITRRPPGLFVPSTAAAADPFNTTRLSRGRVSSISYIIQ